MNYYMDYILQNIVDTNLLKYIGFVMIGIGLNVIVLPAVKIGQL